MWEVDGIKIVDSSLSVILTAVNYITYPENMNRYPYFKVKREWI